MSFGLKKYPNALVAHLPRTKSDHRPLLLRLMARTAHNTPKPFKMEPMWCSHPLFRDLVLDFFPTGSALLNSIQKFQEHVSSWNKEVFGNIFKDMRRTLGRISGIHRSPTYPHSDFLHYLEKSLLEKYDNLLLAEKEFWMTKSSILWLVEGDASINVFHTTTLTRRRRNRIVTLETEAGKPSIARKLSRSILFPSSVIFIPRIT